MRNKIEIRGNPALHGVTTITVPATPSLTEAAILFNGTEEVRVALAQEGMCSLQAQKSGAPDESVLEAFSLLLSEHMRKHAASIVIEHRERASDVASPSSANSVCTTPDERFFNSRCVALSYGTSHAVVITTADERAALSTILVSTLDLSRPLMIEIARAVWRHHWAASEERFNGRRVGS